MSNWNVGGMLCMAAVCACDAPREGASLQFDPMGFDADARGAEVKAVAPEEGPPPDLPFPEFCNGVDDDGDGLVDAADGSLVPERCERHLGPCNGAVKGPELCQNGAWRPCRVTEYEALESGYFPGPERYCDGVDNDCDGDIDEGLLPCPVCADFSVLKVAFGGVSLGTTSTETVTLTACSSAPLVVTGLEIGPEIGVFEVAAGSLAPPSSGVPLIVAPGASMALHIRYTPQHAGAAGADADVGKLSVAVQGLDTPVDIALSGFGTGAGCPQAVGSIKEAGTTVIPQTNLHLLSDSSVGVGGDIAKRQWQVLQPPGSQSVFIPSGTFPNPTFEANVAGTYVFRLDVWDSADTKSCEPWVGTIVVVTDEAIHVEVTWRTPNDLDETDEGAEAGSDIDLHFVHDKYAGDDPWFHHPYDCFWFNAHPNWGSFDPVDNDDPGLDRDDTDGAGPENLNLAKPQNNTTYRVGVHYWADHGFGDAYVTVRIYIYKNLVAAFDEVRLSHLDMWCVATIDWPSGEVIFCPSQSGEYNITPNYEDPYFMGGD